MTTDHTAPAGLRTRGTILIVPGRGETETTYQRLARRLAADAYFVRVLPPPANPTAPTDHRARPDSPAPAGLPALPDSPASADVPALPEAPASADVPARAASVASVDLAVLAGVLTEAVDGIDPVRPLVLLGADTAAAALTALVASPSAREQPWWPDAVIAAGIPGYIDRPAGDWDDELNLRTQCPAHRGVLSDDPSVRRGALSEALPRALLDAAYASTADVPHLLLVGGDDPLADRDELDRTAKALPTARLTVVRGAHHDVLNDLQHRSVAAEIILFLESLRGAPPLDPIITVRSSTW
jgi:hypothetical protein